MNAGISRDEWLAALEEAQSAELTNDPNLLSLHEAASLLGLHFNTARRHLRLMVAKGIAERREKRIRAEDGKIRVVPAWRLVKKAQTKKR